MQDNSICINCLRGISIMKIPSIASVLKLMGSSSVNLSPGPQFLVTDR